MKTYVYVDGFNLYYGALKGTSLKWLNLKLLAQQLVPAGHIISRVKYFTARVSGASDPDAPRRQAIYLRALQTCPELDLHFGNFLAKTVWRPLINLPVANRRISLPPDQTILRTGHHAVDGTRPQKLPVDNYPPRGSVRPKKAPKPLPDAVICEVHTMEEKGSDVNLAAHLLNDAWKDLFDAAVVISNDTDLVTPIRMVAQERGKPVFIVCPGRWSASPKLVSAATYVRHISKSMLTTSQFDDPVSGTTIRKPSGW